MTVNIENKVEPTSPVEKVDTSSIQNKIDTNITQQQTENKDAEQTEDPNWRAFREARKRDKAEREAAERRAAEKEAEATALKAAMEAAFGKSRAIQDSSSRQGAFDVDYSNEETEDERIEKKVQAAIAAREAAYEKARIEREQTELPKRLTEAYPDYNQVVNEENGAYLEYHHPELYRSLLRQPENFQTCSDIYKIVKKLVPNSATAKKDAAKAEVNFAKPKSMSTMGVTPPGEGRGIPNMQELESKRAARYMEMQKIIKGMGS